MTLDMVFMLLSDKTNLRSRDQRTKRMDSLQVSVIASDGLIKGRDVAGNLIYATVGGKSLAKQMIEESEREEETKRLEARRLEEVSKNRKRKRLG